MASREEPPKGDKGRVKAHVKARLRLVLGTGRDEGPPAKPGEEPPRKPRPPVLVYP